MGRKRQAALAATALCAKQPRPFHLCHDLRKFHRKPDRADVARFRKRQGRRDFPAFEDKEGRIPVTEANKRNIVDPTSALIMPVPEGEPLIGPAACNRTIPVYDGYVRFDVTLITPE